MSEAAVAEPRLPPVTEIGMASLALIVIAGIYLAAHLPKSVPLLPAVILLILSFALLAGNLLALVRAKSFAWGRFWQIFGWALAAYVITAGMIEYAFVRDSVRGGPLVVLMLSLMAGVTVCSLPDRVARSENL
jgi:hypothetical protein